MNDEGFDTIAVSAREMPLPADIQRRHLAMLTSLLAEPPTAGRDEQADAPGAQHAQDLDGAADTVAPTPHLPSRLLDTDADTDTSPAPSSASFSASSSAPSAPAPLRRAGTSDRSADRRRDGAPVPSRRRTRRTVLTASAAVVILAGAGVGTAAALGAFTEPTDRNIAHCYLAADLQAPRTDFALGQQVNGPPTDAATYALDICRRDWGAGRLTTGASAIAEQPVGGSHPVPPLVACVLENGQVGVFPGGRDTCKDLGLPLADL